MKADDRAFFDSLGSMDRDELIQLAISEHTLRMDLELREESNQRINTEMHIQFNDLSEKYKTLTAEYAKLKKLYEKEIEKNTLKTRSTFGRSTEKFADLVKSADQKADDFNDENQVEESETDNTPGRIINFPATITSNKADDKGSTTDPKAKKTKPKSKLKESMAELPCEIVYELDADDLDMQFGEGNWYVAFWREHETIEKIPVPYYVKKIYTPVISVGTDQSLMTMPYSNPLMHHSYVSPSLLADILYRKFVLGLPFHRQAADFSMLGIEISKQTMLHWTNTISPELLDPIWEHLISLLVHYKYVQSDETFIQVNHDSRSAGHKSYMWVHCLSELLDCDPIIVFCYEATRNTDHLRQLFGEFLGYITCDAYISYQVLESEQEGITVTGCLMHCRRYFAEAFFINDVANMTDEEIINLHETRVLMLIREIYIEENKLKSMTAEDRLAARKSNVAPKVDALFEYVHSLCESDNVFSDRMKKALNYAVNQEEKLRVFLTDGNIPCDNGSSERIIRSYSTGRANWLFADTIDGAKVYATMYSIVETAKANEVNVRIYLQYLLEKMAARRDSGGDYSTDFLEKMMPWSLEYRTYESESKTRSLDEFRRMFPEPEKPNHTARSSQEGRSDARSA